MRKPKAENVVNMGVNAGIVTQANSGFPTKGPYEIENIGFSIFLTSSWQIQLFNC